MSDWWARLSKLISLTSWHPPLTLSSATSPRMVDAKVFWLSQTNFFLWKLIQWAKPKRQQAHILCSATSFYSDWSLKFFNCHKLVTSFSENLSNEGQNRFMYFGPPLISTSSGMTLCSCFGLPRIWLSQIKQSSFSLKLTEGYCLGFDYMFSYLKKGFIQNLKKIPQ